MSLTAQACGCSHLLHQLTVLPETITWNVQPPQLNLSTRRRTYVQQDKSLKVQACEEGAEEWSTCSNLFPSSKYSRRGLLLFGLASAAVASPAKAEQDSEQLEDLGRDEAAPPPPAPASPPGPSSGPDTTITDRVFLDISICPNGIRTDRTLGDASQICSDPEPLGRIVIGLYGRQVPRTVANFKAMVSGAAGSSYEGSIFHRVLYGQYIQAGKQGSRERGEVARPKNVDRNAETISASSFLLRHSRPGTVSLSLSENDDDEALKLSPDYRNVEFLITTGSFLSYLSRALPYACSETQACNSPAAISSSQDQDQPLSWTTAISCSGRCWKVHIDSSQASSFFPPPDYGLSAFETLTVGRVGRGGSHCVGTDLQAKRENSAVQ